MKQYKFQALVTLYEGSDGGPRPELSSAPRRMVLRGRNDESGRSQVFTALSAATTTGRSGRRVLAALRLAGDDVTDYLSIGGHFDLWLGHSAGGGRRHAPPFRLIGLPPDLGSRRLCGA